MTEQSQLEELNVNTIMAKAMKTGLARTRTDQPMYGDFTGADDYQTTLHRVEEANSQFMELTADIRGRFDNDPALMLAFINDEANYDEAKKLGILSPEASEEASNTNKGGKAPTSAPSMGKSEQPATTTVEPGDPS